ncbi:dethiobiotin synthase [Paracoccus cavernae]|uniref:dethiobiotin synthase n=1 Tax=Paracoccus cavernae TaxID=1571207 RepID=UPI0035F2BC5A
MPAIIVTGTDTGIGKTLFSAGLTQALKARYWKPVQSGLDEETDSETVARLTGRPVLPEAYRLALPASPHLSARMEGTVIEPARLAIPPHSGPLVIEAAGGLMVPLAPDLLYIDQIAAWRAPAVLCARTSLGTINHTLLSLEALKARDVPVLGVVFVGIAHPENERIIPALGKTRRLGRIDPLATITAQSLAKAMTGIDLAPVKAALADGAAA